MVLLCPGFARAAHATRGTFGIMPDGRKVESVTLSNSRGVRVRLIELGARVQSLVAPDRGGKKADIVLGYPRLAGYLKNPQYFGATVGRFANRLAKGTFTLDGKTYHVPTNDGPNALHGGPKGFSTRFWTITNVSQNDTSASVTFRYVSPDGDMGFPGKLTTTATYSLDDNNNLSITYKATTDKPTIVNLSNHTYWNLSGEGSGSVLNELMMIKADSYTPTDATQIPTGSIVPVAGTPFDFRKAKPIGKDIREGNSKQLLVAHGYDQNWVISRHPVKNVRVVARVEDPSSGRVLTLSSNQPGLQFYSGNFLDGTTVGTGGHIYRQSDAFVLEPQLFPDTPNHPNFGSARLKPGQTYQNKIVYHFSTQPRQNAMH
jgi:aldose 1-epimerase